ncbi:putative dehydrogenase [Paenibacillus shirakamiensis]|uniref:Dehydrogenase n=1 Tax=Paenibacillus shirakamiensis TaxID=1265935 RepID=A0ABS4JGB2_9BACL|nr:Gfo/Idh/MocA family oxidoreductase [Paenibacillus shirakamiensis]MBP2000753.1 putative dehydrogenase [Paenibacillus shirakamiensis]
MIRFGIVGTNWITERFVQGAVETDQFILSAIYSRTEEKGKAFAAKYNSAPQVFTDLEAMVSGDLVDAVYIASPNSYHAEQAMLCMKHGKHVLCEKPMATNTRELDQMIQTAKAHDVVLMEALKSTLMPNFCVIRDNLYKLDRVRRYFASYGQYSSRYDAFKQGTVLNAFNPAFSNGSLMDLGIYCIYPLVALFGEPLTVQASGVMLPSGVDGEGSVLMKYEEMEAVIMHSKISDSYLQAEIQGENGTMVIDKINQPYDVKIHYRDGTIENLTRPQMHESMYYEAKEFIQLIQSGQHESAINSLATSRSVSNIMEQARQQIGLRYNTDNWN